MSKKENQEKHWMEELMLGTGILVWLGITFTFFGGAARFGWQLIDFIFRAVA